MKIILASFITQLSFDGKENTWGQVWGAYHQIYLREQCLYHWAETFKCLVSII